MKLSIFKKVTFENNEKVLEINLLSQKQCNFDCIFCPLERKKEDSVVTEKNFEFNDVVIELTELIRLHQPDLVFINSMGESFFNSNLERIIQFIKLNHIKVRLLSNGYFLGKMEFLNIANLCDSVIGELKVTSDEVFQKIQRPKEGYSFEEHVLNMASFRKQYSGTFIFEITLVKGYNDDPASIQHLKRIIDFIKPQQLEVVTIDYEPFKNKLGVPEDQLSQIKRELLESTL